MSVIHLGKIIKYYLYIFIYFLFIKYLLETRLFNTISNKKKGIVMKGNIYHNFLFLLGKMKIDKLEFIN